MMGSGSFVCVKRMKKKKMIANNVVATPSSALTLIPEVSSTVEADLRTLA
jgi:hypothetical protein